METIIEACKALDYSWLPQTVDGFTLVTSTESDYTILANRISAGEDVLKVPIFHYQNELGWRWSALYDKEVEDYTVHIEMPLFSIRMINGSFIIGEYHKMDECTGLLLYYNELRDEYFAELRYKSYPEIDHHLDAKNLDDLAVLLREHLGAILKGLNERID
ncbi:MAG: hypothetical protein KH418_04845 [Veillonella sp.]|nr:hypothetical protein [Veillonella sp.]